MSMWSGEEEWIRCLVCREHIDDNWCYGTKSIYDEDKAWKKFRRSPGGCIAPIVNARDVEGKYFEPPVGGAGHWRHLYRLISYDPVGKRVNISGIGHVQSGDKTTAAAKDPDKALIGRGKVQNKQDITKYYDVQQLGWWNEACVKNFKNADWRQLPLAIHMGCWKLVQWQLGASVETHLELFAAIMLNISAKDRSPTLGATWFTFDAYRILKVKELIESSRLSKKRKRTRRYPGHTWFHRLPTELLDSILDGLTCKEIQKLETGLGMIVSDRYWRRRAAKNIIEMDEISGEDLNWRYLCRKWEWISKSQDFRNYHYIMGVLRDQVKPVFLKNLTERKFPCLKDVVAAI